MRSNRLARRIAAAVGGTAIVAMVGLTAACGGGRRRLPKRRPRPRPPHRRQPLRCRRPRSRSTPPAATCSRLRSRRRHRRRPFLATTDTDIARSRESSLPVRLATPGTLRNDSRDSTTPYDSHGSAAVAHPGTSPGRRARPGHWFLILVTAAVLALASDLRLPTGTGTSAEIGGPFASLLAASTDLGPARGDHIQLTATLHDRTSPDELIDWADAHDLSVRWQPGDDWAIVEGGPDSVARALRRRDSRLPRAARAGVLRLTAATRGTADSCAARSPSSAGSSATHRITRRGRTSCRWTCPIAG